MEKAGKKFLLNHVGYVLLVILLAGALMMSVIAGIISSIAALLGGAAGQEEQEDMLNEEEMTGTYPLDAAVLAYKDDILKELKKYGKEQYIFLYLAVVQQESGGNGTDIFQCSESLGKEPGTLSVKEAIAQGVKYLSDLLDKAEVTVPDDIAKIKIALQAYNFGEGFIGFVKEYGGNWSQQIVNLYAYRHSNGVKNQPPRDEQLGMWKYGDQYYTQHVLRYYYIDEGASDDNGSVQGIAPEDRMKWLFPSGIPTSAGVMEQYLTTISVPVCDTKGKVTYVNVRCHRKLAASIKACFEEMAEIRFPVQYNGCYVWRQMSGSDSISHHSYGVAVDINAGANAQYTHGDKSSPYFINSKVVKIWKSHGFYWGGDWDDAYVDPMHFTYTDH